MSTINSGAVEIAYETTGPSQGPALLLVMGLGSQLVAWPPRLVEGLAEAGWHVITFDNRDVGRSTWLSDLPPVPVMELLSSARAGQVAPPPYTLEDMADDGMGLLDGLGISQAHVLGVSMGGMIAQRMALAHPDRVRSLASVMSTTGDPSLPGPTPEAATALLSPVPIDDRDAYVAAIMEKRAVLASPGLPLDEQATLHAVERTFDRGVNPAGFLRQYHAVLADGDRTALLRMLRVPTLVIHGTDDPLIRVQAGTATAKAIPDAQLELIDGMGHDLPPAVCDRIVELLAPRLSS